MEKISLSEAVLLWEAVKNNAARKRQAVYHRNTRKRSNLIFNFFLTNCTLICLIVILLQQLPKLDNVLIVVIFGIVNIIAIGVSILLIESEFTGAINSISNSEESQQRALDLGIKLGASFEDLLESDPFKELISGLNFPKEEKEPEKNSLETTSAS